MATGKSWMVSGFVVVGVCCPLVSSLTTALISTVPLRRPKILPADTCCVERLYQ